ncbi:zinc ribbon domain-containing protein [Enorma burkinafasonensis]|uniref:zinc ribbon domain-containing protein n=1 Tax=Enorma burkinafasonensis TaxID=2590867 RepID=UPI0011AACC3C|nr:zinc ribbon domain-containing protein [Enorma burkinafasonensis]
MFCSKCGSQVPDGVSFCSVCGAATGNAAPAGAAPQAAPASGAPSTQAEPGAPSQQAVFGGWNQTAPQAWNAPGQASFGTAQLGMKWYKFVIWFQLFAAALLAIGQAIQLFTGLQYEGSAHAVYLLYGGVRVLDILTALVMLGLAAFAILVRFELAGFKRDAPMHYLIYLAAIIGVNVLYSLLFIILIHASFAAIFTPSFIGTFIGYGALIFANKIYFDKRQALFVN